MCPAGAPMSACRGGVAGCPAEHVGYRDEMEPLRVGLVADPAKPTEIARRIDDRGLRRRDQGRGWDIEVVSEPFTTACEDVPTALSRLEGHAQGC